MSWSLMVPFKTMDDAARKQELYFVNVSLRSVGSAAASGGGDGGNGIILKASHHHPPPNNIGFEAVLFLFTNGWIGSFERCRRLRWYFLPLFTEDNLVPRGFCPKLLKGFPKFCTIMHVTRASVYQTSNDLTINEPYFEHWRVFFACFLFVNFFQQVNQQIVG